MTPLKGHWIEITIAILTLLYAFLTIPTTTNTTTVILITLAITTTVWLLYQVDRIDELEQTVQQLKQDYPIQKKILEFNTRLNQLERKKK